MSAPIELSQEDQGNLNEPEKFSYKVEANTSDGVTYTLTVTFPAATATELMRFLFTSSKVHIDGDLVITMTGTWTEITSMVGDIKRMIHN